MLKSEHIKQTTIYGLTDECGNICYVGKTVNMRSRFKSHLRRQDSFNVTGMARLQLIKIGDDVDAEEKRWIRFFGRENLFNKTDGGSAWANPPSLEHRNKIAKSTIRRWQDPVYRKQMSEMSRDLMSDEHDRNKLANRIKILRLDDNWQAKITAIRAAMSAKPEYRKNLSAALRRVWADQNKREKLSATIKSICKDKVYIEKRSLSLKTTLATPEVKARRSRAMKLVGARPEIRQSRSEASKRNWVNPEFKKLASSNMKIAWQSRKLKYPIASCVLCRREFAIKTPWQKRCPDKCRADLSHTKGKP